MAKHVIAKPMIYAGTPRSIGDVVEYSGPPDEGFVPESEWTAEHYTAAHRKYPIEVSGEMQSLHTAGTLPRSHFERHHH